MIDEPMRNGRAFFQRVDEDGAANGTYVYFIPDDERKEEELWSDAEDENDAWDEDDSEAGIADIDDETLEKRTAVLRTLPRPDPKLPRPGKWCIGTTPGEDTKGGVLLAQIRCDDPYPPTSDEWKAWVGDDSEVRLLLARPFARTADLHRRNGARSHGKMHP